MQTCALIHIGVARIREDLPQQGRANPLTYHQLLLLCYPIFLLMRKKGVVFTFLRIFVYYF